VLQSKTVLREASFSRFTLSARCHRDVGVITSRYVANCTEKLVPRRGSDSSLIAAPILAATSLTIAKPSPLPFRPLNAPHAHEAEDWDPAQEDRRERSHHCHLATELGSKNGLRYEGVDTAHDINDLGDAEAHCDIPQTRNPEHVEIGRIPGDLGPTFIDGFAASPWKRLKNLLRVLEERGVVSRSTSRLPMT
jgi:hypothetical protein